MLVDLKLNLKLKLQFADSNSRFEEMKKEENNHYMWGYGDYVEKNADLY